MIQIQNQIAPPVTEGPIEHLLACHRRIEDRLAILERAGEHLEDRPEESLLAISNSLRFLDTSGVLHTVDEEESVFPGFAVALPRRKSLFSTLSKRNIAKWMWCTLP